MAKPAYVFFRGDVETAGGASVPYRMDDTLRALLERVVEKYGLPAAIVLRRDEQGRLDWTIEFILDPQGQPGRYPQAAAEQEKEFDVE